MKTKDKDFKEKLDFLIKREKFLHHLDIKMTEIDQGKIAFEMPIKDYHKQGAGFLQGGVTATLVDTAAGFAAFTMIAKNEIIYTAQLELKYLRPGVGEKAVAIGTVLKLGSQFIIAEAEIYCEENQSKKLVAKGSGTFSIKQLDFDLDLKNFKKMA